MKLVSSLLIIFVRHVIGTFCGLVCLLPFELIGKFAPNMPFKDIRDELETAMAIGIVAVSSGGIILEMVRDTYRTVKGERDEKNQELTDQQVVATFRRIFEIETSRDLFGQKVREITASNG
jgi:hypothetical protein